MSDSEEIKRNSRIHDRIATVYEKRHDEIFNSVEQDRLQKAVSQATNEIKSSTGNILALDYGCGAGNITKFLLEHNLKTVAADISKNFLSLVRNKFSNSENLIAMHVNGYDLSAVKSGKFDLVTVYSVLHHVPDYLKILEELMRVLKKGGVLFIDHENCPSFWENGSTFREFANLSKSSWKKYANLLKPSWYLNMTKLMIDPQYQAEGDIHVFPHDHIDWDEINRIITSNGCSVIYKKDYLHYKQHYKLEHFDAYKNKCSDMRCLIARKNQ